MKKFEPTIKELRSIGFKKIRHIMPVMKIKLSKEANLIFYNMTNNFNINGNIKLHFSSMKEIKKFITHFNKN